MTNNITGDRIATKPASDAFRDGHERIWPSRKPAAHVVEADPDERQPQCGDCNGTRRVDGRPCGACAPTDDGPDEDAG